MRIRKHARILAPPVSPSPTEPDTHVCQLNRSPWDVFALTQEYEHQQVKVEEKYTCDSVGGKSAYAYDRFSEEDCFGSSSIASREELEDEDNDVMDKKYFAPCVKKGRKKKTGGKKDFDYIRCGKIDGKGWQCKKEAKQGEVLCEHHLVQLETYKHKYNYNYHSNRRIAKAKKTLASKTKTVLAANKKRNRKRVSSAPPDDFYFYCGFGPSRNKRKVQENEAKEKVGKEIIDAADHASSSSEVHVSNEFDRDDDNHDSVDVVVDDFLYDDDDDEDEDENGGKKRIRKPIKARSLKSLL